MALREVVADWDDDDLLELWNTVTPPMSPNVDDDDEDCDAGSSGAGTPSAPSPDTVSSVDGKPKRRVRRAMTERQIEMRRKRNRESMRRVRVRKQAELTAMHKQIVGLQHQLATLELARDTAHRTAITTVTAASSFGRELLSEIEELQKEQQRLEREKQRREQFISAVSELLQCESGDMERELAAALFDTATGVEDEFAWINAVLPLLPELSASKVSELARQSHLDTVKYMRLAGDGWAQGAPKVLGWSDSRTVTGGQVDFLFSKSFFHEDIASLINKTWTVLTYTNQSGGFQVKDLHLKVVQRINADTLIMARNIYFPLEARYYSALYVLVRVKTVDGYVVSGRSIWPTPDKLLQIGQALGPRRVYVYFHYGLSFSTVTALDELGHVEKAPGCTVRYGGRMTNCSSPFARSWAMDVLLAVLRWENACVGPLYRLPDSSTS